MTSQALLRIAALGLCFATLVIEPAHASPNLAEVDGNHVEDPVAGDVQRLHAWIVRSGDSRHRPFLIIDKFHARVFAFTPTGSMRGTAPVLIGAALGDVSPPDIGRRKLADIPPRDRVTPAGRFEAAMGRDLKTDVLWVDYDAAFSLHRVVTTKPAERRLARLATPSPRDNRISFGCINVPIVFYDRIVSPLFMPTGGVVYVLPDNRAFADVFAAAADDR